MIRTEAVADDLIAYVKTHFAAALTTVAASYDGKIALPAPSADSYLVGEPSEYAAYKTPCVFVVDSSSVRVNEATRNDFGIYDVQNVSFFLGMRVEDTSQERLTRACWRYSQALDNAVHNACVTTSNVYNAIAYVTAAEFGIVFGNRSTGRFRKDFRLRLTIKFFDSITMAQI